MATPSPQRAYRAACPNCGALVDFCSAASACAVCSFCRSTVVREGEALRKIGQSAELFDDHTPLQLGASGRVQGLAFTLVGRLQYRYAQGTWNAWHAYFDNGRSGWLSEDNGSYVLAYDQPLTEPPPAAERLRLGAPLTVAGQRWEVASVTVAKLVAAQGELPHAPNTERGFVVADLRSPHDEVGTLDYSDAAHPAWSVGRPVALAELALTGLAGDSEKSLQGRSTECPNCGAALAVTLATTQSIVCHQCHAVVDLSPGVGGELQHYAQDNGMAPLIPLGTVGKMLLTGRAALPWQVVGYAERCEPSGDDEEQSFWREYLLYHRMAGFAFLIDAQDGWSWSAPITGVPELRGDKATYQGRIYRKLYSYRGQITHVLGEFYWRLERHQTTHNTDYASGNKRLNREHTGSVDGADQGAGGEVVWSAGETLSAEAVRRAFGLPDEKRVAMQRDALPTSGSGGGCLAKLFFLGLVLVVLMLLFQCSGGGRDCTAPRQSLDSATQAYNNCVLQTGNDFGAASGCEPLRQRYEQATQSHQTCLRASRRSSGGGSWGGFSSGGGHK